nr:hypothetical protein [Tanacetum cinerariifolium]
MAMYLAFVVEIAVLFCFFNDQLTNLSLRNSALPDVLLLVSQQPACTSRRTSPCISTTSMVSVCIGRLCHGGVLRIPKTLVNGASKVPKDSLNFLKVLFGRLSRIPRTHAHGEYKVWSTGSE